jgi:hypothetical protein
MRVSEERKINALYRITKAARSHPAEIKWTISRVFLPPGAKRGANPVKLKRDKTADVTVGGGWIVLFAVCSVLWCWFSTQRVDTPTHIPLPLAKLVPTFYL